MFESLLYFRRLKTATKTNMFLMLLWFFYMQNIILLPLFAFRILSIYVRVYTPVHLSPTLGQ